MLDPTVDNMCVDQQRLFIRAAMEENKKGVLMKEEKEMRSEDKNLRHQLDRLREEHSVLTTLAVAEDYWRLSCRSRTTRSWRPDCWRA